MLLADSTSVPMEIPDGRAIVAVSLNGRGPYRVAVETGSPDVLVSSLATATLPAPDGKDVLRATRVGPFVGIPVSLGGVVETGVIDTQGGVGLQAIDEVAGRLSFQAPPRVVGRAVVGGGAPVPVREGVLAGDAMLGRHRISRPRIAVHPLPADIPSRVTIGLRVLQHFAVALDQRTMAVRLTR